MQSMLLAIAVMAAGNAPIEPALQLPTLVVVATKSERPLTNVAASVTVIEAEHIADQLAIDPTDLIRYQPAISVPRGSTRFGSSGYNIRGIGGNRVAIEIDGIPVADQFDIGSYANADRDLVDVDLIKRVEILRGPASTLYGSDAIGGVVAYTTIHPNDFGQDRLRIRGNYRQADASTGSTLTGVLNGSLGQATTGMLLSATHRNGEQLESAALNGFDDARDYASNALFTKLTRDTQHSRLTATIDHFQRDVNSDIQSLLGSGRFRSTTLLTGDDQQQRDRASLNWELELDQGQVLNRRWADQVQVLLYHQRSQTEQNTIEERASRNLRRQREFNYQQDSSGVELNLQTELSGPSPEHRIVHRIGYGLDLQRNKITEQRSGLQTDLAGNNPTATMLGETFPLRDFPISRSDEVGLYFHDEITSPDSRWTWIPALRFDHYRLKPSIDAIYLEDNPDQTVVGLSENSWSPKLGFVYQLSEYTNVFGQYARGFRAPPFEDANIGLDIPLFNIRAIPNPELRSETSDTVELGWRYFSASSSVSATVHYTDYHDFIETKARLGPDPESGVLLFQSRNIEAAKIYGAELRWEQNLAAVNQALAGFDLDVAMAWTDGENQSNGNTLDSVDPAQLTAALHWRPVRWPITATLHGTVVDHKHGLTVDDPQFRPGGHAVFDLLANYQFHNATLRAGLFNLTDKTYWRWADVRGLDADDPLIPQLSAPGRNAGVSLSLNW